jgi:hypothetical protein
MKRSHIETPRTMQDGEWETGYHSVEEYDRETAEVAKYVLGLCAVIVLWVLMSYFVF